MNTFKSKSLRTKLMILVSSVVVVILVLFCSVLIWSEKKAFENISQIVSSLAENVSTKQRKYLLEIENHQVQAAEVALRIKAESMIDLVSELAPTAIYNFTFELLDEYCEALTNDPDIVFAYLSGSQGDIITAFRNENDKALHKLVPDIENLSIQLIINKLNDDEMVFQVQKDITQDSDFLGQTHLFISQNSVITQSKKIASNFDSMSNEIAEIFVRFQDGVRELVQQSTKDSTWQSIIASIAGIVILTLAVAFLVGRLVIKPVTNVSHIIEEMAKGHLTKRLRLERNDEIGKMADSIDTLSDSLENEVLDSLNKLAEGDLSFKVIPKDEDDALNNALVKMSQNLNATMQHIQDNASELTSSSENLSGISAQLASGSEEVSSQASNVAASTEQINVSSHDITITAEKMSLNMQKLTDVTNTIAEEVREIGNKANMGSNLSSNALKTVINANETIASLQEAADEIGIATATIEQITEQTKLLALNATIEAARAGDSGKGFAVVAGEVKELAKQSTEAAENISTLIKEVQNRTENAAKAINEVSGIITQLNESSDYISTAVNNHSRETNNMLTIVVDSKNGTTEVTENILSLAKGANEVSSNIQGVSTGMDDSTKGIRKVYDSAEELANLATDLHTLVKKFTLTAKAERTVDKQGKREEREA